MAESEKKVIRVGSRASRLAVLQSELVMRQIEESGPDVRTELVTMKTTGDKILDRTLDTVGGKGLFVKELDEALRAGGVVITVHSMKDLPAVIPEDLPMVAFTKREDPRDVLVLPKGKNEIDMSLPVGTSSLRRSVQLKELMPGVETAPVRGNVETRLRKLDDGKYSALILAAAGLIRLGLQDRISSYFNTEDMIPAPCQGILGIQARASSRNAYLRTINHTGAMLCAMAERAFIRELGVGCGSPDTAFAYIKDGKMYVTGMRYDEAKGITVRKSLTGAPLEAKRLGRGLALLLKEVF